MRRILVVDDDRLMVRTLGEILRLHGWDTASATSGEEAVAEVERRSFDAVLMDVRMGGIDGVEALRRMKRLRPELRIVLMTAYAAHELLEQAERDGALRVLPKPVAIPSLIAMLEESATGRRVLVVDDNREYLATLAAALEGSGFDVCRALTLGEALAALEATGPPVVVLDLCLDHIPPNDSVMAIKTVSPAVALILYSGSPAALSDTAAALPAAWVQGVLLKPFSPDELIGLLHDLLPR